MTTLAEGVLRPALLPLALLLALGVAAAFAAVARRRATVKDRPALRTGIGYGAALLVGVATLGPVTGWSEARAPSTELTLWVGWDVSASMAVGEAATRFDEGRFALLGILDEVAGSRVGLVVFGATAHVVLPPTRDQVAVERFVGAMEPGLLSDPRGTAGGVAELLRQVRAHHAPGPVEIVLVTDGEWADGAPEFSRDTPPVHLIWTDRPGAARAPAGGPEDRTVPDTASPSPLVSGTGGRIAAVTDPGATRDLGRHLARVGRAARHPAPARSPADGTPLSALLAAVALWVAVLPGRRS